MGSETMEKRYCGGYCIPTELVEEEILWRLPVKSMIRCSSVCKSWYSLIRSRNFIYKTTRMRKAPSPPLVFMHNYAAVSNGVELTYILENPKHPFKNNDVNHRVLPLPTSDPSFKFTTLDPCNGVLCLFDLECPAGIQYLTTFILCNPSINRSLLVPKPQLPALSIPNLPPGLHLGELLGFGSAFDDDPTKQDYKIVKISRRSSSPLNWDAEIYSLNSNSWRHIPIPHGIPNFCAVPYNAEGAFLKGGRLHWIVCHANRRDASFILVFDLNHETFHHISLPKCFAVDFDAEQLKVRAFPESSSIVVFQRDNVIKFTQAWTLKEYGGEESWKTIIIDQLADSRFIGSAITDKEDYKFIEALAHDFEAFPLQYVPSLVLLNKQNS